MCQSIQNKKYKYEEPPCYLCRSTLNRALTITHNILLLIDQSIAINYASRKTRGVLQVTNFFTNNILHFDLRTYISESEIAYASRGKDLCPIGCEREK